MVRPGWPNRLWMMCPQQLPGVSRYPGVSRISIFFWIFTLRINCSKKMLYNCLWPNPYKIPRATNTCTAVYMPCLQFRFVAWQELWRTRGLIWPKLCLGEPRVLSIHEHSNRKECNNHVLSCDRWKFENQNENRYITRIATFRIILRNLERALHTHGASKWLASLVRTRLGISGGSHVRASILGWKVVLFFSNKYHETHFADKRVWEYSMAFIRGHTKKYWKHI